MTDIARQLRITSRGLIISAGLQCVAASLYMLATLSACKRRDPKPVTMETLLELDRAANAVPLDLPATVTARLRFLSPGDALLARDIVRRADEGWAVVDSRWCAHHNTVVLVLSGEKNAVELPRDERWSACVGSQLLDTVDNIWLTRMREAVRTETGLLPFGLGSRRE